MERHEEIIADQKQEIITLTERLRRAESKENELIVQEVYRAVTNVRTKEAHTQDRHATVRQTAAEKQNLQATVETLQQECDQVCV